MTEIRTEPAYDIDEPTLRALLRAQHPDLAELRLSRVDGGFDNRLWRVGEDLAARLPQTDRAPFLQAKEFRWLPELAPTLPLPVPVPVRSGDPGEGFPRPWLVVRWLPGDPADRVPVSRGSEAATALAGFLRALHRPAPGDPQLASRDRGVPLRQVAGGFGQAREYLSAHVTEEISALWEDALAAPEWTGPALVLHADLHPANVVVADGTLAGVIDFGDMCAGDPATDLAAAWLLLPAGAIPGFLDEYGLADEAMIRRARGWAVLRALGLISIGLAGERGLPGGKVTWGTAGRAALERITRV